MADIVAYWDDYGAVTVYVNRNFFGGRTDHFVLTCGSDYVKEMVIKRIEERQGDVRYHLIAPADMAFGRDYMVREAHGRKTSLIVRLIVRTRQFRDTFTYEGDDLGAIYHKTHTDFAVWAPTAVSVYLKIVNHQTTTITAMTRQSKGVYRARICGDLKKALYVYMIKRNGVIVESLDPYAYSSLANGAMSAVINIDEIRKTAAYRPDINADSPTDAVIYECSVRDMTSSPHTGTRQNGTFAALTEEGTSWRGYPTGLSYLKELGITHVQFMPVGDFVTVDEYHPKSHYNWGYDPGQYLCLEGSYATHPDDPYARMKEFRRLVDVLHKNNIFVNCDVVFNHCYDHESSAFEKTVPFYYFRYDEEGHLSNGSWCGNDFDATMPMARKLLLHVVAAWMNIYDVDGFRFDLMGILDIDTMNLIASQARKIKPYVMIYGEGWNMPTDLDNDRKADIDNQAKMPHIGHFNDYFRDVAKGRTSDDQKYQKGYLTGDTGMSFSMLSGLVANTQSDPYFYRFDEPGKSINAMETHDNATMWDKMHFCCANEDRATRQKRQKMMLAVTLISQGVPFLHAGSEYCGTKQDNSNSYNAGDDINGMDWDRAAINRTIVEYTKALIALRRKFKAFRLSGSKEIADRVKMSCQEGGVIFYDISYPDEVTNTGAVSCIINPTMEDRTFHFEDARRKIFDENGFCAGFSDTDIKVPALSVVITTCDLEEMG